MAWRRLIATIALVTVLWSAGGGVSAFHSPLRSVFRGAGGQFVKFHGDSSGYRSRPFVIRSRSNITRREVNFFGRLGNILSSIANAALGRAETPERLLDAAERSIHSQLQQATSALADLRASSRQTARQLSLAEESVQSWQSRAESSMRNGRDADAKSCLAQRLTALQAVDAAKSAAAVQSQAINELTQSLVTLQTTAERLRSERSVFLARANVARLKSELAPLLNGTRKGMGGTENLLEAVARKVEVLEEKAAMAVEPGTTTVGSGSLDSEWIAREREEELQSEFDALRMSIGLQRESTPSTFSSSPPRIVDTQIVS